MKTAVISGHTGLIGRQLLTLLLQNNDYGKIVALGRKLVDIQHPKFVQHIVDFDDIQFDEQHIDDVYCCLGTTMKKAGTKEKFRMVDFQYPLNLATQCLKKGAKRFAIVSSMGADEKSLFFYNQVKGEVEMAINQLAFSRIDIFRPSLLLGHRHESRLAEDMGKGIMKMIGFLFLGPLKNYKAIDGAKVANAMLHFAADDTPGSYWHTSAELQDF